MYFVVDVNGRIGDGPRVVKSSGFDEFDAAAVGPCGVPRRFLRCPILQARPLSMSMRVIFDNPVIR